MKKIIFLYLIIMVMVFGSVLFVHAQTSTIPSSTPDLQLPEFTHESSSIASMINKIYIYALSIAGVLAIVMIVYGGISYALDPGNAAKQGEAKEIMQSAIWGIVLLVGAYVILKTINPDLVQLKNLPLEKIQLSTLDLGEIENDTGSVSGGTSIGCTTENTNTNSTAILANSLLSLNPDIQANPKQNLQEIKDGKLPTVCDGAGGTCSLGGTTGKKTVCPALLEGLVDIQTKANANSVPHFTITSIMTGAHSTNSTHYQGRGLDVVPQGNQADWNTLLSEFGKYATAAVEYKDASGNTQFIKLGSDLSPAFASGTSDQHIHMNFGGAGTMDQQELASVQKKAQEYLKLKPNLLSGYSWGIPPISTDKSCSAWFASPLDNVNSVAQGSKPFVCDGGHLNLPGDVDFNNFNKDVRSDCACNQGGQKGNITIHGNVFELLATLEAGKSKQNADPLPDFQVVALTGGIQAGMGNSASTHYSGTTFDIVPINPSKDNFEKLRKRITDEGYNSYYEFLVVEAGNNYSALSQTAKFTEKFAEKSDSNSIPIGCWGNKTIYTGLDNKNDLYSLFLNSMTLVSTNPVAYNLNGSCSMLRIHVIAHQG